MYGAYFSLVVTDVSHLGSGIKSINVCCTDLPLFGMMQGGDQNAPHPNSQSMPHHQICMQYGDCTA